MPKHFQASVMSSLLSFHWLKEYTHSSPSVGGHYQREWIQSGALSANQSATITLKILPSGEESKHVGTMHAVTEVSIRAKGSNEEAPSTALMGKHQAWEVCLPLRGQCL